MAIKPVNVNLTATSVEILNAIRANASAAYQAQVPAAQPTTASIREIGQIVTGYVALQNEFFSSLCNRIARVIVTSRTYYNPWAMFKRGFIEMGETVEEVFVNIAKPFQYDPAVAEKEWMKREIPDVRSAFHTMNFQKFYKVTISDEQLRQAFLSWEGLTDLIARIVDSLYTGVNYDEFQVMKYMLARNILNGYIKPVTISAATAENAKSIISTVKAVSNKMTFMSGDYNISHVKTNSEHRNQYFIVGADFDAIMDVEVLAAAFNMTKAEFIGNRVLIDGFGQIDNDRLAILLADDPNNSFTALTPAELTALNAIPAVILDRNYFMIFDNLQKFAENYNGQGLYWQYFMHIWKTFSSSPFAQAALFVPGTPTVTSVTISPKKVTANKGDIVGFAATVVVDNFAPKDVIWSVDSDVSTISNQGVLTIDANEAKTNLTVTCTSVFDSTKSDTATVTVS